MVLEQIAFAANILAGTLAAYTDLKTGYIYDWITYPLIGIGLVLTLLTQQWMGLLLAVLIYGIGLLAYNSGKMGGGDIKLLTGIALVQPVFHGMVFVLAVLLVAALSACAVLGVRYVGAYLLTRPKITWNTPRKRVALLLLAGVIGYALFSLQIGIQNSTLNGIVILALIIGTLFYGFEDEIKTRFFLRRIKLDELEDDEVLAVEHLSEEEKNKFGKEIPGLVGMEDVKSLQHRGFHTIPVYRNLPKFAPFLLLGIIITYLFPDALTAIVPAFL